MDDLDELLASLSYSNQNSTSKHLDIKNKARSINDNSILGGYNPSGLQQAQKTPSRFGHSKIDASKGADLNVDDMLKIFDDNYDVQRQMKNNEKDQTQDKNDNKNNENMIDAYLLKEKRASLFGISQKNAVISHKTEVDREYKETYNLETTLNLKDKSQSILYSPDTFPTIDIQHSRRGRNSVRVINNIETQKEEKIIDIPFVSHSSTRHSIFEDNSMKNIELEGYTPSQTLFPSNRNSTKTDSSTHQKRPRLLKSHDEKEVNQPFQNKYVNNNDGGLTENAMNKDFRNTNRLDAQNSSLREISFNDNSYDQPTQRVVQSRRFQERDDSYDKDNYSPGQVKFVTNLKMKSDTHLWDQHKNDSYTLNKNLIKQNTQTDMPLPIPNESPAKQITYNSHNNQARQNPVFSDEQSLVNNRKFEEMERQVKEETVCSLTSMRNNYESQLELMRSNHEQQLQHERKIRQSIVEEMQGLLTSEKERINIFYEQLMKTRETSFDFEKQQMRRNFEEESDVLKKQLEQSTRMVNLAEGIKINTDALNSISYKYDESIDKKRGDQEDSLKERLSIVAKEERRVGQELEFIENERKRIGQMREDFHMRETLFLKEIDQEKAILKQEYTRLNDLQSSICSQQQDKNRQMVIEKQELMNEKKTTIEERYKTSLLLLLSKQLSDKLRVALKEEYEQKYRQFEMQITLFQNEKNAFDQHTTKLDTMYKHKIQEVEETRQHLIHQESLLSKRSKALELKQYEVNSKEMDCKKSFNVSFKERQQLDFHENRIQEFSQKVEEEQNRIIGFRESHEEEKRRLERLSTELLVKERKIQQDLRHNEIEKRDIQQMQRTLQSLKSDSIRQLDTSKPFESNSHLAGRQNNSHLAGRQNNSYLSGRQNTIVCNPIQYKQCRSTSLSMQCHSQNMQTNYGQREKKDQGMNKPPLKMQSGRGHQFNLMEFMIELKQVDEISNLNQAYILRERDCLADKNDQETHNNHQHTRSRSFNQQNFYESSPYRSKPSDSSFESSQP